MHLVTGCKGHLGKFLNSKFQGSGLHRKNWKTIKKNSYDTIIHSAARRDESDLYQFYLDNIRLTEKLCKLPHNFFIFLSTVDVYNKNNQYAHAKLISESIVKNLCKNYAIIRMSSLLGTKPNFTTKTIDNLPLVVSSSAVFNCILYKDVYLFIQRLIELNHDRFGGWKLIQNKTFNLVASNNCHISNLYHKYNSTSTFGHLQYHIRDQDGYKAYNIMPELSKTSLENVKRWIHEYRPNIKAKE